jgi:hypothetical protein
MVIINSIVDTFIMAIGGPPVFYFLFSLIYLFSVVYLFYKITT